MLSSLSTLATVSALTLLGAGALASDVQHDCCAPQAAQADSAFNPSTPALQPIAGPRASGLVIFTGDVAGRALHEGDAPEVKPLVIDAKASVGCVPDGAVVDPTDMSLLVSKDGALANVVITVTVEGSELKVPEKPIHLDQSKCQFDPHVVVIPAGSQVAFLNSDKVNHNVHTYAKRNDSMNKTIAAGSQELQTYAKTDEIAVKCDIHPWMTSFLIVTDTPYYAVTDLEGRFSIAGLPAGTHKVEYWHEKLGKGKAEITVAADGTAKPLEIRLGGKAKGRGRR